jgi:hypothetical protein
MLLEGQYLESVKSYIFGVTAPIQTNLEFAGIFGLNPYAFFLILLIGGGFCAFFGKIWYDQRKRKQAFQQAGNKVLCEFCSEGSCKAILCEVFKGQVKSVVNSSRATFSVEHYIGRSENKLSEKGILGSLDFYFFLPDHAYPYRWPEGKPFEQQITVMKTHYYVNDPMPKITYRPQEWNSEAYERTTASLLRYAQDEKVAEVAVGELSGKFNMFEKALVFMKQIPTIFFIQLGQCFILLVIGFLAYKAMGNSDMAVKFLTGVK